MYFQFRRINIVTENCIFFRGYATQHIFTGLKALTQYTYCVRLLNDTGIGPWSCTVTVTTDSKYKLL